MRIRFIVASVFFHFDFYNICIEAVVLYSTSLLSFLFIQKLYSHMYHVQEHHIRGGRAGDPGDPRWPAPLHQAHQEEICLAQTTDNTQVWMYIIFNIMYLQSLIVLYPYRTWAEIEDFLNRSDAIWLDPKQISLTSFWTFWNRLAPRFLQQFPGFLTFWLQGTKTNGTQII